MTIERTAKRSVNYKMCKRCKGKYFCQEHSGIYSPSDFTEELTISFIKQLLEEKKACISSCVFSDEPQKIYLYLCVPEIGKVLLIYFPYQLLALFGIRKRVVNLKVLTSVHGVVRH